MVSLHNQQIDIQVSAYLNNPLRGFTPGDYNVELGLALGKMGIHPLR